MTLNSINGHIVWCYYVIFREVLSSLAVVPVTSGPNTISYLYHCGNPGVQQGSSPADSWHSFIVKTNKFQGHISHTHTRYPGCGKQEIDQLPHPRPQQSFPYSGRRHLLGNPLQSKQASCAAVQCSVLTREERKANEDWIKNSHFEFGLWLVTIGGILGSGWYWAGRRKVDRYGRKLRQGGF